MISVNSETLKSNALNSLFPKNLIRALKVEIIRITRDK
jgi:hypothetical protein